MPSMLPAVPQTSHRPTLLQSSRFVITKGTDNLPGPSDYVADDRFLARHARAPKATFGRSLGHIAPGTDNLPGPSDYVADDRFLAGHARAPKATFGRSLGHIAPGSSSHSPGPADYKFTSQNRHVTSAIIGKGPGHGHSIVKSTPGPTDYAGPGTQKRILGGNYFSSSRRGTSCGGNPWSAAGSGSADERRQFRQNDADRNGVLDFSEVWALLLKGDRNIQEIEVRKLFQAMDANDDGHIQFDELHAFLHSESLQCSQWRKKLQAALALARPGPGDYNIAQPQQTRSGTGMSRTRPSSVGKQLPELNGA